MYSTEINYYEDKLSMNDMTQARQLLGIPEGSSDDFIQFRTGCRTRAVLATHKSICHKYNDAQRQVLIKLYKGDGKSEGSLQYQNYHSSWFHQVNALVSNQYVQQSVTGGLHEGIGPYAVVQFVPGEELSPRLDQGGISKSFANQVLKNILINIWIPLWSAGLRFKDCHAGNFVVSPGGSISMIDTEQMRKDVDELLHRPDSWTQRDKHQKTGLSRLPGLVKRIVLATTHSDSDAKVLREIKASVENSGLTEALHLLGRAKGETETAEQAAKQFLLELKTKGFTE